MFDSLDITLLHTVGLRDLPQDDGDGGSIPLRPAPTTAKIGSFS
jgi:hypothetical protein